MGVVRVDTQTQASGTCAHTHMNMYRHTRKLGGLDMVVRACNPSYGVLKPPCPKEVWVEPRRDFNSYGNETVWLFQIRNKGSNIILKGKVSWEQGHTRIFSAIEQLIPWVSGNNSKKPAIIMVTSPSNRLPTRSYTCDCCWPCFKLWQSAKHNPQLSHFY